MSSPAVAGPAVQRQASAMPGSVQREPSNFSSSVASSSLDQSPKTVTQDDIACLAYALWERRGRPEGSAEQDWLEAEQQLTAQEQLTR
jgi:hypothetical protein